MDPQSPLRHVNSDSPSTENSKQPESPLHNEAKQKSDSGNQKPTNPFRKDYDAPGDDSVYSSSPEPNLLPSVRKNTPVRAVFYDLPTAHSSITSGTARSKLRPASNSNSDVPEEENSIPLQDLELLKRDGEGSILQDIPLPQLSTVLSMTRYSRARDLLTDEDEIVSGKSANLETPIQPSLPETGHSVFSSIKNALVSVSSPSQTHWPRGRQKSKDYDQDNGYEADFMDDYSNYHSSAGPVQYPPSTPGGIRNSHCRSTSTSYPLKYQRLNPPASSPPLQLRTNHHKFSRLVSGSTEVSLPEGSTIGNIVQHYAGSEGLDGDGNDLEQGIGLGESKVFQPRSFGHDLLSSSPLYEPLQLSSLQIRKQRWGDKSKAPYTQSPQLELPGNRHSSAPASSSEIQGYKSTSLPSPQETLGVPENPRTPQLQAARSLDSNDFFDESISDAANSTLPSLPRISYRNPFRPNPTRFLARADPDHCVYDDEPHPKPTPEARVPLEREVSQALRRASGYSLYSVGSASSLVLDYGAILNYDQASGLHPKATMLLNGKDTDNIPGYSYKIGGHIVDEQAKVFYDRDAIPTNWINSRQSIRVPINHNGSFPDSPPESPVDEQPQKQSQRHSTPADDNNDWETVGESGIGLDYRNDNDSGLIGGTVRRTGSSIANTSDDGTASIHLEDLDEFGSTERIAQHPGTIQYSGDYRQRDLKKTQIPILMPVFNGHKVNGYLADSMRIRPPRVPTYFRPAPLTESHKHPFNSTPPEVMPPSRAGKLKSILRSQLAPTDSKATSSSKSGTQGDRTSTYRKPSFASQSFKPGSEWTDSYRQTGPSVSTQRRQFAEEQDRPSSWQHVMAFANGGNVPGYRKDGSRICDPQSIEDGLSIREVLDDESQINNVAPNGKRRSNSHAPVVPSSSRRPPGAFYQGLRAVSDQKRLQVPGQHDGATKSTSRRSTAKAHGTTSLRPLSLLNDRLPSTPLRNVSNQSDMGSSDDFVYRSPLAPPLRSTWQKLYSTSRLFELQQRAKADGVYSSRSTLPSSNEGLSRRHLYEPPKLAAPHDNNNDDPDVRVWKIRFSVVVLVLCCFFPPLLILFALGKMDGIMIWWSDGEFSGFGKAQKKWAGIVLCTEVFIIGVLLIAFLASFFSKHHG
ncbi:hypothetical protein ONS95_012371 [Cadophora gregata]|uniref:uncharacterized protein n=1 Tax=Cadophora gregata TaxID=51156 RepID=UPI0026DCFB32|nr:uncharacterized protein ONS95_012371 [Cadophora gregata]KAK0118062.1 hypothetical protein ONS95_012371 [Cadophora gregata]